LTGCSKVICGLSPPYQAYVVAYAAVRQN